MGEVIKANPVRTLWWSKMHTYTALFLFWLQLTSLTLNVRIKICPRKYGSLISNRQLQTARFTKA